jgi:hypothetical protein
VGGSEKLLKIILFGGSLTNLDDFILSAPDLLLIGKPHAQPVPQDRQPPEHQGESVNILLN